MKGEGRDGQNDFFPCLGLGNSFPYLLVLEKIKFSYCSTLGVDNIFCFSPYFRGGQLFRFILIGGWQHFSH